MASATTEFDAVVSGEESLPDGGDRSTPNELLSDAEEDAVTPGVSGGGGSGSGSGAAGGASGSAGAWPSTTPRHRGGKLTPIRDAAATPADGDSSVGDSGRPSLQSRLDVTSDARKVCTITTSGEAEGDSKSACSRTVLAMAVGETLVFVGAVRIRVLAGVIHCFGAHVPAGKSCEIIAPAWSPAVTVVAGLLMAACCTVTATDIQVDTPLPEAYAGSVRKAMRAGQEAVGSTGAVLLLESVPSRLRSLTNYDTAPVTQEEAVLNEAIHIPTLLVLSRQPEASSAGTATPKRKRTLANIVSTSWLIPGRWDITASRILESCVVRPACVLVAGAKGVGKSSFARFLANFMISGCRRPIAFLDMDLGQPEACAPGMLALHVLESHLFSLPHTHLHHPFRAIWLGDLSSQNPDVYLNGFARLLNAYRSELASSGMPLIVNTQGWVRGLGLALLRRMVDMMLPTHIVQFHSPLSTASLELAPPPRVWTRSGIIDQVCVLARLHRWSASSAAAGEIIAETDQVAAEEGLDTELPDAPGAEAAASAGNAAAAFAMRSESRSAHDLRMLRLIKYFLPEWDEEAMDPRVTIVDKDSAAATLARQVPWTAHWSRLTLGVMHCEVPASQILYAFNCSLVGLCADAGLYRFGNRDGSCPTTLDRVHVTMPELPRILLKLPSNAWCLGLGIVVSINMAAHTISIVTPLSEEGLSHVNILLVGAMQVPNALSFQGAVVDDLYFTAQTSGHSGSGANRMKSRNNLRRARLS